MVNTLRIASVAAVILAGLVLASVTGFASLKSLDASKDEELSRILNAPSVVETFKDSQGDEARSRQDAMSPLVREAEAFALFLNPPVPVPPVPTGLLPGRKGLSGPPVVPPPSAKFDLLGTSYSAASQNECFAYILMQDKKTYRWVRRGDEIGYMLIKEIRGDSIICWDGNSDVPMFVPERPDTSSMLEETISSTTGSDPGIPPSAADRITRYSQTRPAVSSSAVGDRPEAPLLSPMTAEEEASLGRLVNQIRESGAQSKDRTAMVNRLKAELSLSRARAEEAANPGNEPNGSPIISPLQGRPGLRRRLGSSR